LTEFGCGSVASAISDSNGNYTINGLDTGTHESLSEASTFVEVIEKRQGLKIACLEEIAYKRGWINRDDILRLAEPMKKNQYGQYLLNLIK